MLCPGRHFSMRFLLFLGGLAILALGVAAMKVLENPASFGFLQGALMLGGGFIICGGFCIRWPLHGVAGAAVLALLGAGRGLGNLAGLPKYLLGDRSRGPAPALESAVALICLMLLFALVKHLFAERARRQIEELKGADEKAKDSEKDS